MKKVLAIDIGASSGRHVIGFCEKGDIKTEEIYRFPNHLIQSNGKILWDIPALLEEVRKGIDIAIELHPDLSSLSIDTWAVDYVLLNGNEVIGPYYAYRDSRTEKVIDKVHQLIPFEELYSLTGIQFESFNTIYQLADDLYSGRLQNATDYLMIPEYLMYCLTGTKVHEYTNATTTGLLNAVTKEFDFYIIEKLGLPKHLFSPVHMPGEIIGQYKGIDVVLTATHDTGSAVEGIPMKEDSIYISSGTWSLLGVKVKEALTDDLSRLRNFSNEGGVGYIRYQKNIIGLWLVNELRRELCPDTDFSEITKMAERSGFDGMVDTADSIFFSPESMKGAFDLKLSKKPEKAGDYFRAAYRSLALSYDKTIRELEENTKRKYKKLYIVGGGAKNHFLNKLTKDLTGKEVIVLPLEATALGNIKLQLKEAD